MIWSWASQIARHHGVQTLSGTVAGKLLLQDTAVTAAQVESLPRPGFPLVGNLSWENCTVKQLAAQLRILRLLTPPITGSSQERPNGAQLRKCVFLKSSFGNHL